MKGTDGIIYSHMQMPATPILNPCQYDSLHLCSFAIALHHVNCM
jgi:hypothetical protein